jgi:voltage-gated potassium channel
MESAQSRFTVHGCDINSLTLRGTKTRSRQSPFDSFYWSFITATTVGYGDVRPERRVSRILSILIALVGLTLTGILIAVAIHAATLALAAHDAAIKAQ